MLKSTFQIFLGFILISIMGCSEDQPINTKFNYTKDGIVYEQIDYYANGEKVIIDLNPDMTSGTYKRMDKNGRQIEKGRYVDGKLQKGYTSQDASNDSLVGLISFIAIIGLIVLIVKKYQSVLDWYRKRSGKIINR